MAGLLDDLMMQQYGSPGMIGGAQALAGPQQQPGMPMNIGGPGGPGPGGFLGGLQGGLNGLAGMFGGPDQMMNFGLALASKRNPVEGLTAGLGSIQKGRSQNQTVEALVKAGIDRQTAVAAMGNPELMKALIAQRFQPPKFSYQSQGQHGVTFDTNTGSQRSQAYPEVKSFDPTHTQAVVTPPGPGGAPPQLSAPPPANDPTMSIPQRTIDQANAPAGFNDRFTAATPRPGGTNPVPTVQVLQQGQPKAPPGYIWNDPARGEAGGSRMVPGPAQTEATGKLNDDFRADQSIQRYQKSLPIMQSVRDVMQSGRPGGAADLNLIYAMAQIFDPGSVVREAEQILGRRSGGPAESIQALTSWVQSGQVLTPEVRSRLTTELESRMSGYEKAHNIALAHYNNRAKSMGIDPSAAAYDVNPPPMPMPRPSGAPGGQPQFRPAQQRPDMMTPGDGGRPLNMQIPPAPPGLPPGSQYSPSRQQWRTPDGQMLDAQGRRVGQ